MGNASSSLQQERCEHVEAENLPKALCRAGEAKEVDDDTVPQELADQGEDDKGDDERKEHGDELDVAILHGRRVGIDEAFKAGTGGRGEESHSISGYSF